MSKANNQVAILAICGIKNVGKTTLIEKLIPFLLKKGYNVGYLKHDGHEFEADVSGRDSYRMQKAGAGATAVFSSTQYLFYERKKVGWEEMIEKFSNYDLLLMEGGKDTTWWKLEVIRKEITHTICSNKDNRLGIITDMGLCDSFQDENVLPLNDLEVIARFCVEYVEENKRRGIGEGGNN